MQLRERPSKERGPDADLKEQVATLVRSESSHYEEVESAGAVPEDHNHTANGAQSASPRHSSNFVSVPRASSHSRKHRVSRVTAAVEESEELEEEQSGTEALRRLLDMAEDSTQSTVASVDKPERGIVRMQLISGRGLGSDSFSDRWLVSKGCCISS